MIDKTKIKRILLVSLSNIGDVVLTFPVVDILVNKFPSSEVSVIVGPKAETLLEGNPNIEEVIVFDKHQNGFKMLSWILGLRKKRYDMVIDLRNTAIPFLVSAKYKTSLGKGKPQNVHMKRKHLERLKSVVQFSSESNDKKALVVGKEDSSFVDRLLKENGIVEGECVVIAPGAADRRKRWLDKNFSSVADEIIKKYGKKIVLIGDENDRVIAQNVVKFMENEPVNLCGKTSLIQTAEVIRRGKLLISNDSAPMHIASYLDVPVLALFGPTNPISYGPWSNLCKSLKASSEIDTLECEDLLKSFDILSEKVIFNE